MNKNTILSAVEWAEEEKTSRSVNITVKRLPNEEITHTVYCYDFFIQEGKLIETSKDIPTNEELLRIKNERILEEMERMNS